MINGLSKNSEKELTPITTDTNNIKYLGVTLTKQVKDMYDKNFMYLRKKLKKILKSRKTSMFIDQ